MIHEFCCYLRVNNETSAMSITLSNCIVLSELEQPEQPIYIPLDKIHCTLCRTGAINFWDSNETFSSFGDWEATLSDWGLRRANRGPRRDFPKNEYSLSVSPKWALQFCISFRKTFISVLFRKKLGFFVHILQAVESP
jgi:hypothetical protein